MLAANFISDWLQRSFSCFKSWCVNWKAICFNLNIEILVLNVITGEQKKKTKKSIWSLGHFWLKQNDIADILTNGSQTHFITVGYCVWVYNMDEQLGLALEKLWFKVLEKKCAAWYFTEPHCTCHVYQLYWFFASHADNTSCPAYTYAFTESFLCGRILLRRGRGVAECVMNVQWTW